MVGARAPPSPELVSFLDSKDLPERCPVWVPDPSGGEPQGFILWRDGAVLAAYANRCPHAGRRLDFAPGRFLIRDGVLVCPAHGASFRLADGACLGGPCRGEGLTRRALREEGGRVLVADESGA
jgi:nitrite reductase/ring-hydroxylating ferredoxin subunit